MKLLILGATGMAGHTISIYMQERGYDVTTVSSTPFLYCKNILCDLTSPYILEKIVTEGNYTAIINCVGILNKTAEDNKHIAVSLNSYLPHYLVAITKNTKTKVIHMSTDCVFSGDSGEYDENSLRDGLTFYDRSKALGEIENNKDLTFRNSIIGPDTNEGGIGLFNWFMKQSGTISGYNHAIWTGVTTLTLAKAMESAIKEDLCGLYHLVNNTKVNKYELLKLFNKYFRDNVLSINESSDVTANKSLINNRSDFDFIVPSYEEMVFDMHQWVCNHKNLYPHYFN